MIGPTDLHLSPAPHFKRSTNCQQKLTKYLANRCRLYPKLCFCNNYKCQTRTSHRCVSEVSGLLVCDVL